MFWQNMLHPRCSVGLLEVAAVGQWRAAVEDAYVVQPKKAAFKEIVAIAALCGSPTS